MTIQWSPSQATTARGSRLRRVPTEQAPSFGHAVGAIGSLSGDEQQAAYPPVPKTCYLDDDFAESSRVTCRAIRIPVTGVALIDLGRPPPDQVVSAAGVAFVRRANNAKSAIAIFRLPASSAPEDFRATGESPPSPARELIPAIHKALRRRGPADCRPLTGLRSIRRSPVSCWRENGTSNRI